MLSMYPCPSAANRQFVLSHADPNAFEYRSRRVPARDPLPSPELSRMLDDASLS